MDAIVKEVKLAELSMNIPPCSLNMQILKMI